MNTTQPMNLALGEQDLYQGGFAIGGALRDTFNAVYPYLLKALLIVAFIVAIMYLFTELLDNKAEEQSAGLATLAYMNMMYHNGCKSKGGCSASCPFIDGDDPRVEISNQAKSINDLLHMFKHSHDNDINSAEVALDEITDADTRKLRATTWNSILATQKSYIELLTSINNQVRDIDSRFSTAAAIDIGVMAAKNQATAFGAAASLLKQQMNLASLHLGAQTMVQFISDVPKDKQMKILGYDQMATQAAISANNGEKSITNIFTANSPIVDSFKAALDTVSPVTKASTADVLTATAWFINANETIKPQVKLAVAKVQDIFNSYNECRFVIESFSNDLPNKMDADKMTAMIESGDYESAIIQTALESDTVSNHKKFSKERSSFESGGGVQSVRDDDNDIVPWVGIFGRPTYRRSDGNSVDQNANANASLDILKSIPSDVPDQIMRTSSLRLSTTTYKK